MLVDSIQEVAGFLLNGATQSHSGVGWMEAIARKNKDTSNKNALKLYVDERAAVGTLAMEPINLCYGSWLTAAVRHRTKRVRKALHSTERLEQTLI